MISLLSIFLFLSLAVLKLSAMCTGKVEQTAGRVATKSQAWQDCWNEGLTAAECAKIKKLRWCDKLDCIKPVYEKCGEENPDDADDFMEGVQKYPTMSESEERAQEAENGRLVRFLARLLRHRLLSGIAPGLLGGLAK